MILKITLMPRIKETFVGSNVNSKSTLQYPFELCSDVSFIGTIFSRNWHFCLCLLYQYQIYRLYSCCSHYWYLFNL